MRPSARRRALGLCLSLTAAGCLKIPAEGSEAPTEVLDRATIESVEVWPGKGAGELYAVGETRTFILRRGDAVIGRSWGRYDGPTDDATPLHRFTTRVELRFEGREPLRSAGSIVLDDRGRLIRGDEQAGPTRLRFSRDGDDLVITDGRQTETLKAGPETAYMAFAAIFHEELMLGLRPLRTGSVEWRLVSLSGSLPVDWAADIELEGAAAEGQAPRAHLETSLGEDITFAGGRILAIDVADEGLSIRPGSEPWPEWELTPPRELAYAPSAHATFTRRDVDLPGRAEEPKLAGEVLIPAAARKGPRPAVLFLSGNGRQDRYGFAGPPPVDLGAHAITDALAEAGFVVLRFDERGEGQSGEGPRSWALQLEDARRALRTLLVQEEVDPDRIAVVGHGEGGWRALELSREGRGVIAVALLATPGRRYRELLDEQAKADIDALPPELQERARAEHKRLVAALERGDKLPPELADEGEWARGLLKVDPEGLIAGTEASLWIAQGDRDFEVDPDRDPTTLQAYARKHSKRAKVRRFPGLDHLFKHEPATSTPTRYLDPDGPRVVDPGFLEALSGWLVEATQGGKGKSAKKTPAKR
ncbi:MAG: alpha/beta hydrolase [Myxococcales bacterium]|nr:alpha/beta hydrolase [Myxococcales bacterium]